MREELIEEVAKSLKREGFKVKQCIEEDICFDIVAKRDRRAILIKAVDNVDSVSRIQANDMKKVSYALNTAPIIVGLRSRRGELIEGIVYERYGVRALRPETFDKAIRGKELPIAIVKRGGILVKINGHKLRKIREEEGLSLGEIASRVGVTRKAIYEYERGTMYASLEVAIRLEEELSQRLIEPIDVFGWECKEIPRDEEEEDVLVLRTKRILEEYGLRTVSIKRAPFNIAASDNRKERKIVLQARREIDPRIVKRIRLMIEVAEIVDAKSLIVTNRYRQNYDVEGVPVVTFNEFSSKVDELIEST
ncbi:MAG: transcriptional regulator [Thermoprotei archaeon]|nr:transcriptional regulator [Thermoprotei archaeon]